MRDRLTRLLSTAIAPSPGEAIQRKNHQGHSYTNPLRRATMGLSRLLRPIHARMTRTDPQLDQGQGSQQSTAK
jgi:hypothetical protein